MKIVYENEKNFLSGKLFFRLDGTFEAIGPNYVWTYGKGVYGIFEKEELIYIGETTQSFIDRFRSHSKCIKENSKISEMYKYIRENFEENKFYMRPLVEIKADIKLVGELQLRDVQAIELGFITCFKPKFNIMGVYKDYKLNELLPEYNKNKQVNRKTAIEYEEKIVGLEIQIKEKELERLKIEKEYENKLEEKEEQYKKLCEQYDYLVSLHNISS